MKPKVILCLLSATFVHSTFAAQKFATVGSLSGGWTSGGIGWSSVTGGPYTDTWGAASADNAVFEGSGGAVNVSADVTISQAGIAFNTDNVVLSGGTITMYGGNGVTSYSVSGANTATINSQISAPTLAAVDNTSGTGFQKNGTGTLKLGGTGNTYNSGNLTFNYSTNFPAQNTPVRVNAGTLEISGGSHENRSEIQLGQGGDTASQTFTQSAGTFNLRSAVYGNNTANNGLSTFNFTGGTFNQTPTTGTGGDSFFVGNRGGSTVNISGTADVLLGILSGNIHNNVLNLTRTVNLDGGTLSARSIEQGTSSSGSSFTVNLNGGLLKSRVAGDSTLIGPGLSRVNVRPGGARIEAATGQNLTIASGLSHSNLVGDAASDGGLTKSGDGTLILTAANTYTGTTTITAGTLELTGSGSISSSPSILVNAGTVLQGGSFGSGQTVLGTGTLAGSMSMGSGSVLSPAGAGSIGSLTVGGALNLAGQTQIDINKTGTVRTSDQLTGTGSVTLGGALVVTATGDALVAGDSFTLINTSGGLTGDFTSFVLPTLPAGLSWDKTSLPVNGTIKVVTYLSTPTFSPPGGSYVGAQSVSITSDSGSTIYYTTDGSPPTTSSPNGISPITGIIVPAGSNRTIRAFAYNGVQPNSAVATASYTTVNSAVWNVDDVGSWSEAGKWLQGAIPDAPGTAVDFFTTTQSGDTVITLDSNRTIGSVTFGNVNPYNWFLESINDSVLTLSGATPTVNVQEREATISASIGGSDGLLKDGDGTLILSGANFYSGDTTVLSGVLKLGASNTLPDGAGKGNLLLAGTLDLGTYNDTVNGLTGSGTVDMTNFGSSSLTVGGNGVTSTFNGVIKNTQGTLAFGKTGSGTFTFTQPQAYSGNTTISGGILEIPSGASIGTATGGKVEVNGGTLKLSGGSVTSYGPQTFFISNTAPSTFDFSAGNLAITVTSQFRDVYVGNTAPGTWNQTGGVASLNVDDLYIGNNTGAAGSSVNLSGGSFSINANGNNRRGVIIGVRSNSSLSISGSADATIPSILFGYGSGATPAGVVSTLNLNGGTLQMTTATNPGGRTAIFNFNGGLLRAYADSTAFMSGLTTANVRNGGAKIHTGGHTVTLAQPLVHSTVAGDAAIDGGLTKSGTGTLILSGASSYNGPTGVTAGTLLVDGSLGNGDVTVSAGATLGGTGTVAAVTASGSIAPGGTGVGTLATGTTTITGTYECEVDGTDSDKLTVTGDLDLNGSTLHLTEVNSATASSFVIATYTGTLSASTTPPVITGATGYTLVIDDVLKQVRIETTVSPYGTWASDMGLTAANNGKGDNPDNDGLNNLGEFAINGNPLSGTGNTRYVGRNGTVTHADLVARTVLTLTLPVRNGTVFTPGAGELVSAANDGLVYRIQGSTALADWSGVQVLEVPHTAERDAIQAGIAPADAGWSNRTFYIPNSVPGPMSKNFMRARVDESAP